MTRRLTETQALRRDRILLHFGRRHDRRLRKRRVVYALLGRVR